MTCTGTAMKLELGWSHGDNDIRVTVEGCYYAGRPAKVTGPPESCYPEDPDEFEIHKLSVDDGQDHAELEDDARFLDALMDAAREEYAAMIAERRAEQAADREYWKSYDTGR